MKIYKYKDNVDTDVIIPARYLNSFDAKELASHAMADIDPTFATTVEKGDIIVAGQNFGCGSSREHAPLCLKTAGVKCVIAKSFARIFYRNSINIGFPIMECEEAADKIEVGDEVEVDFSTGVITNKTKNETYQSQPFPEFLQKMIDADGLVNYVNSKNRGLEMEKNIAVIKGDGIGPEIVTEAMKILDAVAKKYNHKFNYTEILMGGCSIDAYGVPLSDEALKIAKKSDSVLLGAIGGNTTTSPWYKLEPSLRPEAGLLKIRKELGLFANLRPAYLYDELKGACPLKEELTEGGFDMMIMRELTGGLYFGERSTEKKEIKWLLMIL